MNLTIVRQNLISLIEQAPFNTIEEKDIFLDLIEKQPNTFFSRYEKNHFTGSILALDKSHENVLLVYHKKFDKWVQPGGHWMDEGIPELIIDAALREMYEEAYGNQEIPVEILNKGKILDFGTRDGYNCTFYDVTFLIEVDENIPLNVSFESCDVQWIPLQEILKNSFDDRLQKMCSLVAYKVAIS